MNVKKPSHPSSSSIDLDTLPLMPDRGVYVMSLILKRHNWRHSVKDKGVSNKTMQDRSRFCIWLIRFLRNHPSKSFRLDPRSFSGRHVAVVIDHWRERAQAGELGPATLQTYFSHLRTFTGWIGKPKLLKPIGSYFEATMIRRHYAAQTDISWKAKGIDVGAVIAEVEQYDCHAAASLSLMRAFGLRFKESVMLRPFDDVLTAAQAGKLGDGMYLDTHRGTKGGLRRFASITLEVEKQAIERARQVARPGESVSDQRRNLAQAERRLRYVMEKFGITQKDLGVTPKGLRTQHAGEEYTDEYGGPPPVVTGVTPHDAEADHRARLRVARRLGHGRPQIAGAYVGARKVSTPETRVKK
jgi:Integrase